MVEDKQVPQQALEGPASQYSTNRFASRIGDASYELETGGTTWARGSVADDTLRDHEKAGLNQSMVAAKLKAMRLKNSNNQPNMVSVANLRREPQRIGTEELFNARDRSG